MPMTIQSQLEEIAARLARASQELQVAREQVAFQTEVSDDAQVRMVVSGTPLADREYREARDDLERLRRHEERTRGLIAELNAERDQLLDRLLEAIDTPADIVSQERGRRSRRS
ncbi:MAG: hypothetical protein ACRDJU_09180 [Actinomycetota bacterium]